MLQFQFQNTSLPALGMGCMRLPTIGGDDSKVDMDAARHMVAVAMEAGINYFDTAWGYHHGHSEPVMGEILRDYPRDSFYLASKFPGYDLSNFGKVKDIFEAQLVRCQVDYFDFYLFHCLTDENIDAYLNPDFGVFQYLTEQKKLGRIRHLGFSSHCSLDTLRRFLDAYGEGLEFGQIQLNWLDYTFQNAKEKIDLLKDYGIPVWVMEPVRGGALVNLSPSHVARLNALRPHASMAEWAFRFLQTIPDVALTLSGMSNEAQLRENISIFSHAEPLNQVEWDTLLGIADEMIAQKKLPCTACRYCTNHCPQELNIPALIERYNAHIADGAPLAIGEELSPALCIGCQACEMVCPQNIKISEMMSRFAAKL